MHSKIVVDLLFTVKQKVNRPVGIVLGIRLNAPLFGDIKINDW